jgi:urease accessory protein UreH
MIKTTGKELKNYFDDKQAWPDGAWHEDECITVDGANANDNDMDLTQVADDAKITIEGGIVLSDDQTTDGPTMESHFRAWRKRQTTATLIVTVDKAQEAALRELIKQAGGKVSG